MVEKLCSNYGEKICEYEGNMYYAFPEVEKLTRPEVILNPSHGHFRGL